MTLKEKFNSIDQSRITADQKAFLDKMKNVTKDFTLENKEVNDKVEGALDKMIASFKEKMPDAIKTSTKVVVPKSKKSTFEVGQTISYPITKSTKLDKAVKNLINKYAEKELVIEKINIDKPYNTAKVYVKSTGEKVIGDVTLNPRVIKTYNDGKKENETTKVVSKTTTPKRTVMSVAKEIRKEGESWKDAQKRASEIIKSDKAEVSEVVKKELDRINKFINSRAELKGISGTNIKRDAVRTAKPRGVRTVTKSGETSNKYGTFSNKLGRRYWESRDRHADRLAPNYPKDAPLLAEGGLVEEGDRVTITTTSLGKDYVGMNGVITSRKLSNDKYSVKLSNGLEMAFDKDEFKHNSINPRYADGGYLTDPTFGTFQNQVFADGGDLMGFEQKVKDALKVENKWHYISENVGGKSVDLKMYVGKKEVDVQIFKINGVYARMPKNYVGKRETFKMIMDNFEGNYELGGDFQAGVYEKGGRFQTTKTITEMIEDGYSIYDAFDTYEQAESVCEEKDLKSGKVVIVRDKNYYTIAQKRKKYELGGTVVSDLAGHTGGSLGGDPSILSGFSNTGYDGLVGETGAMSSGEMFMNGGGLPDGASQSYMITEALGNPAQHYAFGGGLPAGAEQSYVNYYLGEGSAQGIYKKGGAIENQYEGRTPENVWNNWDLSQKLHFLSDHTEEVYGKASVKGETNNEINEFFGKLIYEKYDNLPLNTKVALAIHTTRGQYKGGGMLDANERYVLEIKGLTGLRKEAIESYIAENNLSDNDVLNIVIGLGRKQLKGTDVASAVVGKKGNALSKKVIEFAKDNKGMKLEEGGNIDAFTLRMVKGTAGNPDEAMAEPRSVQFAFGGGVAKKYNSMPKEEKEELMEWQIGVGRMPFNQYEKFSQLTDHHKKLVERHFRNEAKKMATGGGVGKISFEDWLKKNNIDVYKRTYYWVADDGKGDYLYSGTKAEVMKSLKEDWKTSSEEKAPSQKEKREAYLENLLMLESEVWDKIGANSGGEIRQDEKLLRKYAEGVGSVMEKEGVGYGSFDEEDYEYFQDGNSHLLNEFLVWNNYYEPTMTKKEKAWRLKMYDEDVREKKKYSYVSNPEVITLNSTKRRSESDKKGYVQITKTASRKYVVEVETKGGDRKQFNDTWSLDELEKAEKFAKKIAENQKVKYIGVDTTPYDYVHKKSDENYIVHADIISVTVKKGGKEVTYSGKDVLNGANVLADGGGIEDKASYFSKNNVVSVELKDGKTIKPANGYWVDKHATPIKKFDDGGEVTYFVNKDGIKVRSVAKPEKELSEAEWMAKHSESKEARGYAYGGGVDTFSEYSNDALYDMMINLSRYENTESEIQMIKDELERRKGGNLVIEEEVVYEKKGKKMATGGGVSKFEKLSNKVAKNYEGKRVKPQYQMEYGKVYSKEEAKEVGDKVAGKVKAMQKMNTGGEAKKGGKGAIMILAKQIRKDGEKWTDAVKRAGKQLK